MRRLRKKNLGGGIVLAILPLLIIDGSVRAAIWNSTTGGNWSDTSSAGWNGAYPNAVDVVATISTAITAPQIINLDVSPTVGNLTLGNASYPNDNWMIQDTNNLGTSLTFQVSTGSAILTSNGNAANAISTPVILNSTLVLHGSGVISGNISGTSALTKTSTDSGKWVLSGTNTYAGITTISKGTLQFAKEVSLYDNNTADWTLTNIIVSGGATAAFNVGGTGEFTASDIQSLASLTGTTHGFLNGSFLGLDTTNATGGVFTYSDAIINPSGHTLGLTKLGTNILSLTAANTYTGVTTVASGTLSIGNGGTLGNTAITVSSNSAFQAFANTDLGTSSAGAATLTAANGSTLAFADSGTPGAINLYGSAAGNALTLNGATLSFNVGGVTTAADELVVNGGTAASLTAGNIIDISPSPGTTNWIPGDYTLISDTGLIPSDFTLGTTSVTVGSTTYLLSLNDSTSSGEVLTISAPASAVPEPASCALLLAGLPLLLKRRRHA